MTARPEPPRAPRRPTTVTRHGETFEDPYAWLRDRDDPAVRAHLEAENAHAAAVLAHLDPLREELFAEIRSRVQETDASAPVADGGWCYYHRTVADLAYPIHCRRPDGPDARRPVDAEHPPADEQVVLDENALAAGHDYLAVGGLDVSPDHRLAAYLVDTTGSERFTLRIRDLASGTDIATVTENAAYGLAWMRDSATLLYTVADDAWRPFQVWRHRLGADPGTDGLVLEEPDERFWLGLGTTRSRDLVVVALGSKSTSEIHLLDAHDPDAVPRVVAPRRDGVEYHVDHDAARDRLVIITNADAAADFAVLTAPLDRPDQWGSLVPHRPGIRVESVDAFATHLVLSERTAARTQLRVVDPLTGQGEPIAMPEAVYTAEVGPNPDYATPLLRYVYTSLTTPATVIDLDLASGIRTTVKQHPVRGGYDPGDYVTTREWATAPDGTAIPLSIVRRRDTPVDGTAPCLLYGYGAYEISTDPDFRSWRLSLLDRGFVYAVGHVRGGGEMGRAWYEAARYTNKATSFADFAACADHLVAAGYTGRDRLGIEGGSAGGLLVAATLNLRPDLCAAAIAAVPFVDVLNTMSDPTLPLTVVEYEEWGTPEDPAFFAAMRSWSPYDNVRAADYPALLVTAGLNDPRVGFWDPAKWFARLREVGTGDRPFLLKTELGAGHAGPSGRYEAWRERALFLAFLIDTLT
jgi:oligopeptidase B